MAYRDDFLGRVERLEDRMRDWFDQWGAAGDGLFIAFFVWAGLMFTMAILIVFELFWGLVQWVM